MAYKQYAGSPDIFDEQGNYIKTLDWSKNPQITKVATPRPDIKVEADFGRLAGTNIQKPQTQQPQQPTPVAPPAPVYQAPAPVYNPPASAPAVQTAKDAINNYASNDNALAKAESYLQYAGSPDVFNAQGVYQPTMDWSKNPQITKVNTPRPDITNESQFAQKAGTNILNIQTGNPATDKKIEEINNTLTSGATGASDTTGYYKELHPGSNYYDVKDAQGNIISQEEFQRLKLNIDWMPDKKPVGVSDVKKYDEAYLTALANSRTAKDSEDLLGFKKSIEELKTAGVARQKAIDDLYAQQAPLRQKYLESLMPGQAEKDLQKQLADLKAGIDQTQLNAQAGINKVSQQAIPQGFVTGQSAAIAKSANLTLQTQALQEKNLLARLGIEVGNRQAMSKGLETGLSFLGEDIKTQMLAQERLDKQETDLLNRFDKYQANQKKDAADILTALKGVDPNTLSPEALVKIAQIAAQRGISLQDILSGLQLQHDQLTLKNAKEKFTMKLEQQKADAEQANINKKFTEDQRQYSLDYALKEKQAAEILRKNKADESIDWAKVANEKAKIEPTMNLSVDDWVKLIASGQSKLTEVPNPRGSTLRSDVASALIKNGQVLLSDKDREKLSVLDTAFNVADSIKALSEKINTFGTTGRITGYAGRLLGGWLQTDEDIARYDSMRKGFVANVARTLGEKGALAEGDIQRAIDALPTTNDTKDVAEGKIKTFYSILEGAKTSIVQKSTEPLNKTTSGTIQNANQTQTNDELLKQFGL